MKRQKLEVSVEDDQLLIEGSPDALEKLKNLLERADGRKKGVAVGRVGPYRVKVQRNKWPVPVVPKLPKGTTVRLEAPNGKKIIGTSELIPGTAWASTFDVLEDNSLDPHYQDETKVDWDGQKTERLGNQPLYVDEDWKTWPENDLTRIPIDPKEQHEEAD